MPVDAELKPMLDAMNGGPPLREVPLELLRQGAPIPAGAAAPVASIVERTIDTPEGTLRARIYHPRPADTLPVLVFFHGGGFVLGSLDEYDALARTLALGADCCVVSVDYRLAPEHRFPAAVHDSVAAIRWVHAQAAAIGVDPARIAVGGDSAGGNLATVAAMQLRDDAQVDIAAQLLVYPVTLLRGPMTGSMVENGQGYFLRAIDMTWFEDMYLGDPEQARHPHASPLLAGDLGGLPPALVITAEFDPLRDQGEAYARRLSKEGVDCRHSHYAGAFHGFFGMPAGIGRRAVSEACSWLRDAFAGRPA